MSRLSARLVLLHCLDYVECLGVDIETCSITNISCIIDYRSNRHFSLFFS